MLSPPVYTYLQEKEKGGASRGGTLEDGSIKRYHHFLELRISLQPETQ
jgi:hypothetical protein